MSYTIDEEKIKRERELRKRVFTIKAMNKVEFWKNGVHIGIKVFPNSTGGEPMVLGFYPHKGNKVVGTILSALWCGADGEIWFPDPLLLKPEAVKIKMPEEMERITEKSATWLNNVLCDGKDIDYIHREQRIKDHERCNCTYEESQSGDNPPRLACLTHGIPYAIMSLPSQKSENCRSIIRIIFGEDVYNQLNSVFMDAVDMFSGQQKKRQVCTNAKSVTYCLKF